MGYGELSDTLEVGSQAARVEAFARRLRRAREAAGLNQLLMSRVYAVGYATYFGWEQARNMPRERTMKEIEPVLKHLEKHHNLTP